MRARAPASSANLGPGYDALALALDLHCEVSVEPADCLEIIAEGEGSQLPSGREHLAARVVREVLGHDNVSIRVSSEIPVARGLGSSAALALAAAAAAGAAAPLLVAARADGHPDNAAASLLGGLVAVATVDGSPVARRLSLDPALCYVVLVPDRELSTEEARAVLPTEVTLADAVHNLGRLGLLVAGLADGRELVRGAGEDRLHQHRRARLFPEAPLLLARLGEAGAAVTVWSGAGPTLLAVCTSDSVARAVREAGDAALAETGLAGRSLLLRPDLEGLVVEP